MRLSSTPADRASLGWLNRLDDERAASELRVCCAADTWVQGMLAARPFASTSDLREASDALVAALGEDGLAQALGAHGRIGEESEGTSPEATWSREEQGAALGTDGDVRERLREGNEEYERRFGRVFLVRAAGRSAEEMYDALRERLGNDDETERRVVLSELADIVRLRLERLVSP